MQTLRFAQGDKKFLRTTKKQTLRGDRETSAFSDEINKTSGLQKQVHMVTKSVRNDKNDAWGAISTSFRTFAFHYGQCEESDVSLTLNMTILVDST